MAHWSDAYFGELYLGTVADLLTPRLSGLEAAVVERLLSLTPRHRVLDLACGHGRHAWPLARRVGMLVGVERSEAALRMARAAPGSPLPAPAPGAAPASPDHRRGVPAFLRADLRALPLRAGTLDAVFSWYASLFMFDDPTNEAVLREAARPLRRGGRLLVHHANPAALARTPHEEARRTLPDGGLVEEVSDYEPARGVDRCRRRLTRPGRPPLEATAELRYYTEAEWGPLAARAGLRLLDLTSTAPPPGGTVGPEAPDLIALLETP